MTSKKLALLAGASCVAVLATYAWAVSHEAKEVKVEEAAEKIEELAEPARLCIPMAEATDATVAVAATGEASSEGITKEVKTEELADTVKTEEVAAEDALPICDAEGNPPVLKGDTAASEEATEGTTKEAPETAEAK